MPITIASGVTITGGLTFLGSPPPPPPDPNFNQVSLLLHGDGTDGGQNNTFIDGSTNNFTITRNGNTTQGTFSPFSVADGEWSNYFDGTGDRLVVPNNSVFNLGSGNFTIEAWVYHNSISGTQNYYRSQVAAVTSNAQGFRCFGGTVQFFGYSGVTLVVEVNSAAGAVRSNEWNHVAAVRNGNNTQIYINGVASGTPDTTNYTIGNSPTTPWIGAYQTGGEAFNGYMSNFRFVKGTAVYTGNFTPPTAPLTAITNTSLLTCQSNRFIDNSSNAFAITRNGDVRVRPFSPFVPAAAYLASSNGGSGYFDGTGDYLLPTSSTIVDFGTGDFTVEFWVYPLTSATFNFFDGRSSTGQNAVTLGASTTGVIFYDTNGTARITGTTPLSVTAWNHVAVTRSGTSVRLFLNGVQQSTTYTSSLNYVSGTNRPSIGAAGFGLGASPLNGYMANVRVVKGTAVYTAAFTPPTAPVTAITNTSFLLNFTNAGIFDNAAKNDLETVGNAQISTSVKKYGTGSMSFDGTGDWLTIPDNIDLQFGTGPFTIEMWVYRNGIGVEENFVAKGASGVGWVLQTTTSDTLRFTGTTTSTTSTGTIPSGTWTHIAAVREGTGTNQFKLYINGVNDGTGTYSTDFNQTNVMYVGASRQALNPLNGYIDDLRITKGIARYTANFTPPTQAFPDQ